MLSRPNRLKKRDFEKVFKEGRGFKEDLLFLKIVPNSLEVSRFGFALSRDFPKKIVLRNKIKRRLRILVRPILNEMNYPVPRNGVSLQASCFGGSHPRSEERSIPAAKIKKGIDGVIMAYPGWEKKDLQGAKENLIGLLKKAKII